MKRVTTHVIKNTRRNRIIMFIQKFLRFIDIFYKIEQKLFRLLETESKEKWLKRMKKEGKVKK